MRDKLIHLNTIYYGNWNAVFDSIRNKLLLEGKKIKNDTPWRTLDYYVLHDEEYPFKIKDVVMSPFVLFFDGNFDLINEELYGIHGRPNEEDLEKLKLIKNKTIIISKKDFTYELEKTFLENNIPHVVVFDEKIRKPVKNKNIQLFLSEFYTNITNPSLGQDSHRIVLGLGQKNLFINDAIDEVRRILYFDDYNPTISVLWKEDESIKNFRNLKKTYSHAKIEIIDSIEEWVND